MGYVLSKQYGFHTKLNFIYPLLCPAHYMGSYGLSYMNRSISALLYFLCSLELINPLGPNFKLHARVLPAQLKNGGYVQAPYFCFSVAFLAFLAQNVDIGCCIPWCCFLERLLGVCGPALDSSQACAAEEDENGKRMLVFYLLALL